MKTFLTLLLLVGHNCIDVSAKGSTFTGGGRTSTGTTTRTTTTTKPNSIARSSSRSVYKSSPIPYGSRPSYTISPFTYYLLLFPALYIPYLSLTYPDIDFQEFCKLTNCQYTENNTDILLTPKGTFNTSTFLADIGNVTNATVLNTTIINNYGCNLDFGDCMTGSSEKITFDYKLTLGLIAIVTMILYF
jgi:hypothetical protein